MTLEIKSLMSGAIAIVAFCAVNLSAASITWKNSGNDFADGANWNGGVAPADNTTTDIAKFDSASISKQPTLSANRAVAGLDFATPTAGGWIISGPYTFTLGAGTADNGNFGMRALNTSGMRASCKTLDCQVETTGDRPVWRIGEQPTVGMFYTPVQASQF